MRRFLLPVLTLTLALLLSACAGGAKNAPNKQGPEWGAFQVTLENIQQTEKQWSANLAIKNPTDKMKAMQYRGAAKYTLVITREGQEVLRQDFEAIDPAKPQIVNISSGVTKNQIVVWTFRNQAGQPVEPGTYEATVTLNAVTTAPNPKPAPGEPAEVLVDPKSVGPVKITVK